eukprot:jgi/Hompol1/1142/HPOL_001071-RA
MTQEDLESWNEDPESFLQEEEADHWEYNPRACAEKVFMDLVSKNRALLCPIIIEMLQNASGPTTPETMLAKEAVYTAVGLAAYDLYDWFDFSVWIRSHLIHESRQKDRWLKVMRRRISWVIGKWVAVKAPADIRPTLYDIVLSFMARDDDLVVRLQAVNDLRLCIDDFEFEPTQFHPFLESSVAMFMALLSDVDEFESKMKILTCLIVIIERMEGQILPYIGPILQILPQLWQDSQEQNLFRASIVSIVSKLMKVQSTGHHSYSMQLEGIVLPILQQSIDTSQPGHVYLLEAGLELWLITLQNAVACSPALLSLVPFATHLLDYGSESLKRVLHIIEAYVLLDPLQTLQSNAMPIIGAIAQMLGDLRAEASNAILRTVDIILQACHASNCFSAISQVIANGGLLSKILRVVLENSELSVITVGYLTVD